VSAAYFIGVDLHRAVIQVCVLNAKGEVVAEERFLGDSLERGLRAVKFVRRYGNARVAVEAIGMNRWFVNALKEHVDMVVVDPGKLELKKSGKKTDRRDAYEIARRLRLGDIDKNAKTYYPTEEEYGRRKVSRTRRRFTKIRQQLVNSIRAILRAYRIPEPQPSVWTKKGLAQLREIAGLSDDLAFCLGQLIEALEKIQTVVARFTRRINKAAEDPKIAVLVANVPQMGPQTVFTVIAEVGDVSRFRDSRAIASYAGLVPRVANSANTTHHGRITKRGNRELRWILGQWAIRLLNKNPIAIKWAVPLLKRAHKNKVRTALARRLLVGVFFTLRRGEVFSLERCLAA
jgi:transposase